MVLKIFAYKERDSITKYQKAQPNLAKHVYTYHQLKTLVHTLQADISEWIKRNQNKKSTA